MNGAISVAELLNDNRFADRQARLKHASELDEIVEQWTQARSAESVMTALQSAGVPAGVVQTGADLLKDVQLRHRNYFAAIPDSLIGPFEIPRSGILFKGMEEEPLRLPNRLGADNDQILGELLGYDKARIEQWRSEDVLT
jgi:crotonobetainyl-CoA:carnitine CoA-transferase CaiB-like acyl-CoA transferase